MYNDLKFCTACLASIPWLVGVVTPAALADEAYQPVAIVQLPAGSNPLATTDIAWVDPDSHAYALADRSNKSIDVINTRKNEKIRLVPAKSSI